MQKFQFDTCLTYSRAQIKARVGADPRSKGGNWDTGYVQHNGVDIIFANVGAPGRTGHDYDNFFDSEGNLHWRGKTGSHRHQPSVLRMVDPANETHIFWRSNERDPFNYEGIAKAIDVNGDKPVGVVWRFIDSAESYAEDVDEATANFVEGAAKQIVVNAYERNGAARRECIRHHGAKCVVCDMDFAKCYGPLGQGFIHVHHIFPLSRIGKSYQLDAVKDLAPVCPNCHAMLHKTKPPMAIQSLRDIIGKL